MLTIQSTTHVAHTNGYQIYEFLLNPTDGDYQRWWPGTHLALHTIRRAPNHIGAVVYMDEFVGNRRVKMLGVVTEATSGKRITWQFKKIILLPVRLSLDFSDSHNGVVVTHTIRAGFSGLGTLLDPIVRFCFSADFRKSMDEHVKIEFAKLGEMLAESLP
jgi:hypothetical protein